MKKTARFLTAIMFSLMAICSVSHKVMAADNETNKKILKDAAVGAVTGATATEATKDESKKSVKDQKKDSDKDHDKDDVTKHRKHKKHKFAESHRPHGWDKGKKEGWDDKGMPPGLAGGEEHGGGHGHHK